MNGKTRGHRPRLQRGMRPLLQSFAIFRQADVTFRDPIPSHRWSYMKRTFVLILAALAAAALFGGLVHTVLVAAHVSEPAATTVYGLTFRRLWATIVVALGLVGVVIGGRGLAPPRQSFRSHRNPGGGANRPRQRRSGFGYRQRWSR